MIGHAEQHAEFKDLLASGGLSHSYLLYGPERIGKRLFALSFARELESGEFAEEGPALTDLKLISPREGTIGIDAIREMQEFLLQKPLVSPRKTLIVDGADSLTDEAQNALLKIAEEPPASALVFLIVADPERLRPTLQSRFQKIYFSPLPVKDVESWLKSELKISAAEAKKIAKRSEGRPGLAYAYLKDEKFQAGLARAERFLSAGPSERKDILKEISDDEEFDFAEFLDSLVFAGRDEILKRPEFWRRLLELRRQADSYNLNPRLQLTALAEFLL